MGSLQIWPLLLLLMHFTAPSFSNKCADDIHFNFKKGKHTCEDLRLTEELRQKYCILDHIAKKCVVTCGICCYDDKTFRFTLTGKNAGKIRYCRFISKRSKQEKYCLWHKNKDKIKVACPATCGLCRDPVEKPSLFPSPIPSKQLSLTPSISPTLKASFEPSTIPTPTPVDPWSFIVVADLHKAEYFAIQPQKNSAYYKQTHDQIRYVYENYGGDLVLMPGDTNGALPGESGGGKWDTQDFADQFNPDLTIRQRVRKAGKNCYNAVRDLFAESGYSILLVALGDHEIGGNSWGKQNKRKMEALPAFRSAFEKWYNTDNTSQLPLHVRRRVGSLPSRPKGTDFETTSFAYQHKNILFVTLNNFKQMADNFMDREHGLGGEGVITCVIDGKHLNWFENVLKEARKDNSIKHIIVQSHVPVIQPVRKIACSGQFMDSGEESSFWKTMVKYSVDIYLAGEVHATTVTKDPQSNLLQIISRGNQFNNFLKIEVTDQTLNVTSFNEVGTKRMNNMNYTVNGRLTIDKSNCVPSSKLSISKTYSNTKNNSFHFASNENVQGCKNNQIIASGILELLERMDALLHFNFEEILSLGSRQVIGLQHDDHLETLVAKSITIRGIKSEESFPNSGSFGELYDAQIANVTLIYEPSKRGMYSTKFHQDSRFGIFASGPHTPGQPVSFAIWIKVNQTVPKSNDEEMILVHYGHSFNFTTTKKNIFTLTLKNGEPRVYTSPESILTPKSSFNLDDSKWHHLAVSMPKHNCRLSEVEIFVDGTNVETITPKSNKHIFFVTSGRTSIGGFGHSSASFDSAFHHLSPYVGEVDDFFLWSRPLKVDDFFDILG